MVGLTGRGGLPNHRALHPRFDAHHRPTAEEFMTAEVAVRRHSSAGTFNAVTGRTAYPDPTEVWTGWVRLQRDFRGGGQHQIGDRQVAMQDLTLSLPADASEVRVGDEVRVLSFRDADAGDAHLVGRPLWVHNVRTGSVLWQRDLVVSDAPVTSR